MSQALRVARYRSRATFSRHWGGLFALVVLIGLVGGLAVGAVAGARRTQSSFPAYLARINASDLGVLSAINAPPLGNRAYDAGLVTKISRLPHVKQVGDFTIVDPNITPLVPLKLNLVPGEAPPTIGGSLDGQFSTIDRLTVTSGRLADPTRADEVVMSAGAARELGMHVGSVLPVGFFTNDQSLPGLQPAPGTKLPPAHLKADLKLVGIVLFSSEIVQDDIDALGNNNVLLTPTLMRQLVQCCSFVTETSIKVDGGSRNVPAVLAEVTPAIPRLGSGGALHTSVEEAKAERAIEPESIALGVFGAIAAIAVLLIAGQMIGRQLRIGSDDRAVLRALGASPAATVVDGLPGVLGAVVLGALLASVLAVGLSPLTPLGPVRRVEDPSVSFDWTVLSLGVAGLIVVLFVAAVAMGYRQAPHRVARRRERAQLRGSRVGRAAANAGVPPPALMGIRFALEPGVGPNPVPVRSAIVGAVLAMVVVASTLTFATSLQRLVSHPALYGWNWDYELLAGFSGHENLPEKQVANLLDHDPYVSAWSGIYFGGANIDGHPVPVIGASPLAPVAPPLLSGHGFDAPNQVVLGAVTLADLHKHVGDTVEVRVAGSKPTTLRIVGTATMPTIGAGGGHPTMGTGALLSYLLIPANRRNLQQSPIPGPQAVLVRIRKTANTTAALQSLQQINTTLDSGPDGPVGGVVSLLRPAEIVNYRSMGKTFALLGVALAAGAIAALTLTLIASVRRHRRELALLRTLGFTGRQLASVVAWQSTIAAGIGVVVGVPLGIFTGRTLWNLFARAIHAVPQPSVPVAAVTLVAGSALVLANVVAVLPGRRAAVTLTAELLHAE